ncbi:hypothetical protein ACFRFH_11945 [Leifsonia sp. NPDC056824]|uniref:hypothetical protein n=1 Tax=Leifsonia sp. NPDC056824 TaxID=3345953 RepID=UPI0036CF97F7
MKKVLVEKEPIFIRGVKVGEQVISERFVVEWSDGEKTEHEYGELSARYTSQSKDWKPETYGRREEEQ